MVPLSREILKILDLLEVIRYLAIYFKENYIVSNA